MAKFSNPPVFQFHSHHIRTTIIDDQPWFVAKDVADALGLNWTGHVLSAIPESWQRVVKLTTLRRGSQNMRIITEPAVYKLAFRSNKPEADVFTNWVASEVLPAIRKTGKYEAKPKALPKAEQKALPAPKPSIPPFDYWNETLKVHTDICITASHVLNACDSMLDKARHALAHSKRLLDEAPR